MTAIFIRIAIYVGIALIINLGDRKIWREWTGNFKKEDEEARRVQRERDLRERAQPGVIDLKRDKDGTFRPGDKP